MAKRISIITKSPQNSDKVTDSGDSHITTNIPYLQWKLRIVDVQFLFHLSLDL